MIFLFGTVWFWVLFVVAISLIIAGTEAEDWNFVSDIYFVIFLILLYFFGNSAYFKQAGLFLIENPLLSIGIFIGYIILGTVWSFVKWFFYLNQMRKKLGVYQNKEDLRYYKIEKNKGRVLHWMLYWPLSAAWTLVNDPFRKTFEFIILKFGSLYDKMAEKILMDKK